MDVEMTCVCLHYLATFYGVIKLSRQAHTKHRDSVAFLQKLQQKTSQEQNEEDERKRARISQPLREIQSANISLFELLTYLCKNFPALADQQIPSKPENGAKIPRNTFMGLLRAYHPDKQASDKSNMCLGLENWKLLAGEITKMLNHYYETDYK